MKRALVIVAAAAAAGIPVGLALEPDGSHAVHMALLFALVAFVAMLAARVHAWREETEEPDVAPSVRAPREEWRVAQLEGVRLQARAGLANAETLHRFLRPVLAELASVQLARRRGIGLEREPELARSLLSPELWELVRPDRAAPADERARGLTLRRLRALVTELEQR